MQSRFYDAISYMLLLLLDSLLLLLDSPLLLNLTALTRLVAATRLVPLTSRLWLLVLRLLKCTLFALDRIHNDFLSLNSVSLPLCSLLLLSTCLYFPSSC